MQEITLNLNNSLYRELVRLATESDMNVHKYIRTILSEASK